MSRRNAKSGEKAIERMNKLLQHYNDIKTQEESKEIAYRQVHLRRLSLELIKRREDLYPFPIL